MENKYSHENKIGVVSSEKVAFQNGCPKIVKFDEL